MCGGLLPAQPRWSGVPRSIYRDGRLCDPVPRHPRCPAARHAPGVAGAAGRLNAAPFII
ncbi:hypothetical protein PPS11_34033 [Pseudomonas putida S11]|nr:hypothetical protein PPS11_34033 [Pseudomonas putida S11]